MSIEHFPVISVMVLFLGAFLIPLVGKAASLRKAIACIATAISFALTLALIKPVLQEGQVIAYWLGGWQPTANYAIGISLSVDALSLFFALLVSFCLLISAVYSLKYMEKDDALDKYYALFLMLGGGVMGLVLTGDLFNLFIMVEIMTFSAVALTAFRNARKGSVEAAFKYLIIGAAGSTMVLLGTVLLYSQTHTLNMAQISVLLKDNLTPVSIFAFALLFTGFGVKSYIVPFHPVAADAYMVAPSSVSMVFSGMVNKAGVYGMLRLVYTVFQAMQQPALQYILVALGALTMFVGVTMALNQHDFKRLLAYHSISQIGYVITAVGLCSVLGLAGGLYHAMNHTLFKGLLFLCAGAVFYSAGTTDLDKLGGLAQKMPQTAMIFLIGAFSISGLPPFNGFVSKWIIYQATFQQAAETGSLFYAVVTVCGLIVSVMTLASFIKVTQSVFFGQLPEEFTQVKEVPLSMRLPMWIMAAGCLLAGILPQATLQYLIAPAAGAAINVGHYVQAVMGAGYAEQITGNGLPLVAAHYYGMAGYWSPLAWLLLFVIILAAVTLAALTGGASKARPARALPVADDPKYDTFFSGEASEHSHVGGSDLFWGLRYNLKGYFGFLDRTHSGVVNDYALWVLFALAVIIIYMFIFI